MVVVFVLLLALTAQIQAHHSCISGHHQVIAQARSRVSYDPIPSNETHHFSKRFIAGYQPIRILPQYIDTSIDLQAVPATETWLKTKLIPDTIGFFQKALAVIPVTGTLSTSSCFLYGNVNGNLVCEKSETRVCGNPADPSSVTIPNQFITTEQYCPGGTSCTTVGGGGVANTDFVMFITTKDTPTCQANPSVLAYAGPCDRDMKDRPTFGRVNFCPKNLNPATTCGTYDMQLKTAIHEFTHALVFVPDSIARFRDAAGNPLTPRDRHGNPINAPPVACGSSQIVQPAIGANTIAVSTERGHTVRRLVLPNVVAEARSYFNCPSLVGPELENFDPPNEDSCSISGHWESRVFFDDYMAASLNPSTTRISRLTLALFKDSGWYDVDYSVADPATTFSWGYQQGCPFTQDYCINPSTGVSNFPRYFCTTQNQEGCSADLTSRGRCDLATFTGPIAPSYANYFNNVNIGTSNQYMDNCPVINAFSNGDCRCGPVPPTNQNYVGATFGSTSLCYVNPPSQSIGGQSLITVPATACYVTSCATGLVTVNLLDGNSGSTVPVTCAAQGNQAVPNFSGTLSCPAVSSVCPGLAATTPTATSTGVTPTSAAVTTTVTAATTTAAAATTTVAAATTTAAAATTTVAAVTATSAASPTSVGATTSIAPTTTASAAATTSTSAALSSNLLPTPVPTPSPTVVIVTPLSSVPRFFRKKLLQRL